MDGSRFSVNLFSEAETHATKIQSPFFVFAARSLNFCKVCATESVPGKRASTQSSFIQRVSTGWQCASIRPGTTRRPARSTTPVAAPASLSMSALVPTAVMRPLVTATASASGWAASKVVIFAFTKMTSASIHCTLNSPNVTVMR